MKNIFYCSNAHEDIFINNTRSNFNSYIDIHHLEYLHDSNIEAAIKSITYDDKTVIRIKKNHMKPNIVIKHAIDSSTYKILNSYYKDNYRNISSAPDLFKSKEYVIFDDDDSYYAFYEEEEVQNSNFCNLQIISQSYVMHNIFLHDVDIYSENELSDYLNNVLKSISRSSTRVTKIEKDLLQKSKDGVTYLKSINYDIFIESELGNILNLDEISVKAHYGNSLRNIFRWMKTKNRILKLRSFSPNEYIDGKLDYKQEIRYFKVRKRMRPKKVNLKLFINGTLYGIKSNISETLTVRNSGYDDIISLFVGNTTDDVVHVDFKNPTFFPTSKELLSRASFQILEVATNSTPHFATGSPTYIQVVVRKKKDMEKKFNIFLDSSCKKSKTVYPENSATNFTIDLPERLSFRRNWHVTLKSLFLPNNIQNVPECFMFYWQGRPLDSGGFEVSHKVNLKLKEGNYPTIENILTNLSEQISEAKLPITMEQHDGKVKISCPTTLQSDTVISITMSSDLAPILGFTKPFERFHGFNLTEYDSYLAPYEPNLFVTYPKNLIISCDVVDNTIFGGEHVKLLKMVTNTMHPSTNILDFEFLQDEYVDLNVREFRSIKIAILDATGNPVKTDSSIPTRLQLMFTTI